MLEPAATRPLDPPPEERLAALAAGADDRELIQLAAERAGGQSALADLMNVAPETLCRAKQPERHLGDVTREWLVGYLRDPKNPPRHLPKAKGSRGRAGAEAPVAWVSAELYRRFNAAVDRVGSQTHVLEWCVRHWLKANARRRTLPPATTRRGASRIRARISAEALAAFDARVGGAAQRGKYLREALDEGLKAMPARGTLEEIPLPAVDLAA